MDNSKSLMRAHRSVGDAAVDGLLNGLIAGSIMTIYIALIGVTMGTNLAAVLSAFDLGQGTSPVRGVLIHLAIAAIDGMIFSLIYRLIEQHRTVGQGGSVLIGLVYGLLLWSIAQVAITAGINDSLGSLPVVHLVVAHVIYGVTLGCMARRRWAE